ncbi:MAG: thioredoxin family protein, partial [Ruminococcus sp.]|nr:thioredoxin family protein [Ruminococcus sp.]
ENFSQLLAENNSVLAFFRTDWCPLCNHVEEILREIEQKFELLSLFIIDFDKNKPLTEKYKIVGIPTVAVFKDGEIIGCFPGVREISTYEEMAEVVTQ